MFLIYVGQYGHGVQHWGAGGNPSGFVGGYGARKLKCELPGDYGLLLCFQTKGDEHSV